MKQSVRLTIDGREIQVSVGMTVLEAARAAGIEIPTLCHQDGIAPRTSCFLCAVRVDGHENLQPACAALVREGMAVTTDSAEIAKARRTALELLYSDHAGMCVAPCVTACPARLDAPRFIREIRRGDLRAAIAVVKERLPLPAVLGRVCAAHCEAPCERRRVDESISIRLLHRYAADADLASPSPYLPGKRPATGKRVAIVGAGPAGLSAAWFLLQEGHACDLFDSAPQPGGCLRRLPRDVLDEGALGSEIGVILQLGARFHGGWTLRSEDSFDELRRRHDAVLLAFGASSGASDNERRVGTDLLERLGFEVTQKGVSVDGETGATNREGVFAAGEVVTGPSSVVRAVAAGREVAVSIAQYLRGETVKGPEKLLYFRRGRPLDEEAEILYGNVTRAARAAATAAGLAPEGARHEADRCLQCSCAKENDCKLRRYGAEYGARPHRFGGERRALDPDASHPEIVYEPGKCILCGLCLAIAEEAGESRGLSFAGRGFATRVVAPLGGNLSEGLEKAARQCAEACPTAALSRK